MAQKPHPHKETFNNKAQIYRANIINKFKPTINSGSLVTIHLVTKFKVIYRLNIINKFKPTINSGSLVTKHLVTKFKVIYRLNIINKFKPTINSGFVVSIQRVASFSRVQIICIPLLRDSYIRFVSLLFPLIHPHKVVHCVIDHAMKIKTTKLS